MKQLLLSLGVLGITLPVLQAQDISAQNITTTTHEKLGITVVSATFTSPSAEWVVDDSVKTPELNWAELDYQAPPKSERYRKMEQLQESKKANYALWELNRAVRNYADKHDHIGPESIKDLDWSTQRLFYKSPYAQDKSELQKLANEEQRIRNQIRSLDQNIEWTEQRFKKVKDGLEKTKKEIASTRAKIAELEKKALSAEETAQLNRHKQVEKSLMEGLRGDTRGMVRSQKQIAESQAKKKALERNLSVLVAKRTEVLQARAATGEAEKEKPFFYLLPKVVTKGDRAPMILELQPYLDDGKHYVAFSNGQVQRVDIDKSLLDKFSLTVTPLNPKSALTTAQPITYTLYAQLVNSEAKSITLKLVNHKKPDVSTQVVIDMTKAKKAEGADAFTAWATMRAQSWMWHAATSPGSPCMYWLSRMGSLYGEGIEEGLEDTAEMIGVGGRRRGRQATVFNVFGGRAAIRETLQTQVIDVDGNGDNAQVIPIDSIEGVAVRSHEYDKMLAGEPGGQLKIAELVPADRLMVYFRKPADLADFLGDGNSFLFESGATASATCFDHNMKGRYAEILGVGSGWGEIFLKSNLVNEIIAFSPDIFFVDGTDVTVIMDVKQMDMLKPLLGTIGVSGLGDDNVITKTGKTGGKSYWYADAKHLVISSNLKEMAQVRKLMNSKGEGSLGKSAEFRYMLTKLPLENETWAFAYLSDPFIRRLVGPEIKIGQYRRVQAQAEMEALTAAALLYNVDGHKEKPTLQRLIDLGYAKPEFGAKDYVLHDDLSVTSETYGRPSDLTSIQSLKIRKVTASEQRAYKSYMDNYNRFWRQFFDPIAVRLNEEDDGELEAEVFILPLIDSSIYQTVRQVVGVPGKGPKMRVPQLDPPPVAMVSAKLQESVWLEALNDFGTRTFEGFGIADFPFDELGPSVHLAVLDGDPVIALGSGDILGAFNSSSRLFGRNSEMLFIPAALTVFTRPCKLLVELRDSQAVTESLRAAVATTIRVDRDFSVSFAQIRGKDSWIATFDIAGLAKMRFGLKVQNNYLVISNLPWKDADVSDIAIAETLDSAAIHLQPTAGVEQLPGLFAAANTSKRKAAFSSAARLWPMMAAGAGDLNKAVEWHQNVYGFTPRHPGNGSFEWSEQSVSSTDYGSQGQQFEPEFTPGNTDFGLMGKIKVLTLSMQLEDDGLRTRVRWKLVK